MDHTFDNHPYGTIFYKGFTVFRDWAGRFGGQGGQGIGLIDSWVWDFGAVIQQSYDIRGGSFCFKR